MLQVSELDSGGGFRMPFFPKNDAHHLGATANGER
jgi:hypothetical protein